MSNEQNPTGPDLSAGIALAEAASLDSDRGVLVNEYLQTSASDTPRAGIASRSRMIPRNTTSRGVTERSPWRSSIAMAKA